MALAPQKHVNEILDMLTHHIDSKSILDAFSLKRVVETAEKIPDEPTKLMVLGLAYGASGSHDLAIGYFKEAVRYRDDIVARNYLSYLSHTGQYELYRDEAIRVAKVIPSLPMLIRARNAAYADGDGELSLFFSRKALSMVGDENERENMEKEQQEKNSALNTFIEATHLETNEIAALTRAVANIAKKFDVLAVSQDFYTGSDGDAAIICDVLCVDENLLSDMDIDVATELAMHDLFADKNITAWFRGRDPREVRGIL